MKGKGQRQKITPPEREERLSEELVAKALKAKIKAAENGIQHIHKRYPDKSRLQLVRRIYKEIGLFAAEWEIARIERNRGNNLSVEERISLEEDKAFIRQGQPASRNCHCAS